MTKQQLVNQMEARMMSLVNPMGVDYSRLYPYLTIQEALEKRDRDYYVYRDTLETFQDAVVILKEEIRKANTIHKAMDLLKLP